MKKTLILIALLFNGVLLMAQFGYPYLHFEQSSHFTDLETSDFDNDGDIDVLVVSEGDGLIFWRVNDGKGQFTSSVYVSKASGGASEAYPVDIDADGDMDVLATSNAVICYENKGSGVFVSKQVIVSETSGLALVAPTDIDNDGDIDFFQAYREGTSAVWWENAGDGSFSKSHKVTTSTARIRNIHGADLSGNGNKDFLASSFQTSQVIWIENASNGDFEKSPENVALSSLKEPGVIMTEDLDGDKNLDLVVYEDDYPKDGQCYFLNLGNTTFSTRLRFGSSFTLGKLPGQLADMDGDGDIELVTVSYDHDLLIFENTTSTNQFAEYHLAGYPELGYLFYGKTSLGDMNNDGKIDIINCMGYKVEWFENLGDFDFGPSRTIHGAIGIPSSTTVADIDSDGDDDILFFMRSANQIMLCENLGNNIISDPKVIISDQWGRTASHGKITTGDIDGDGKLDLIFIINTTEEMIWYKNQGNGTFDANIIQANTGVPLKTASDLKTTDLDGDGDLDIIWRNGLIYWNENLGNNKFGAPVAVTKVAVSNMHIVDMDNDGDMDVVCARTKNDNGLEFQWFDNPGNGKFVRRKFGTSVPGEVVQVTIPMDVDADGYLDVVQFLRVDPYRIYVHRNKRDGSFESPKLMAQEGGFWENPFVAIFYASSHGGVRVNDLNGDGYQDLYWPIPANHYAGNYGGIVLCENVKGDSFVFSQVFESDLFQTNQFPRLIPSDFDGDGDLDFMLSTQTSTRLEYRFLENFDQSPHKLTGTVFYDRNENGAQDLGEEGLTNMAIQVETKRAYIGRSHSLGQYSFPVDSGLYKVTGQVPDDRWKLTTDSVSYTGTLGSNNTVASSLDFGFHPKKIETSIVPSLHSGWPRCNRVVTHWVNISNTGTSEPNAIVHVKLDDSSTLVSALETPDSIVGQDVYWHFDKLSIGSRTRVVFKVKMPGVDENDNKVSHSLTVSELDDNGKVVYTASTKLEQEIRCSYDPNDKQVSPVGLGVEGLILPKEELTYLIRFQNTGNDTAFSVVVRDQLDANLDWTTMSPLASSHPYEVSMMENGFLIFRFDSILLPDSHVNEPGSHGFIEYSIRPIKDLVPHTEIDGPAKIYFDFNKPIVTNNVLNTIMCYTAPKPVIGMNNSILEADVTGDYTFQWFLNDEPIDEATRSVYEPVEAGAYQVKLTDQYGCSEISEPFEYVVVGLAESGTIKSRVFPNPFSGSTTVQFSHDLGGDYDLRVYSIIGSEIVHIRNIEGDRVQLTKEHLGSGIFLAYLVNTQTGEQLFVDKLIVQ